MDVCKHQVVVCKLGFGGLSLILDFWKRKCALLSEHWWLSWSNWTKDTLCSHELTKVTVLLYGEWVDATQDGLESTIVYWILLSMRNAALNWVVNSLNAYNTISDPVSSSSVLCESTSSSFECGLLPITGNLDNFRCCAWPLFDSDDVLFLLL